MGQVPSWGRARDNHTLMFLSLSFSVPSPLPKNISKYIFFLKKQANAVGLFGWGAVCRIGKAGMDICF